MSLLESLESALGIPMSFPSAKDLLQRTIADYQARVGVFLQQKQRILQLQTRASALSGITKASSNSIVLMSRAKSLLDTQTGLENEGLQRVKDANDLYTTFNTDPFWKNLAAANLSSLGTSSLAKLKDGVSSATSVVGALKNLMTRIQTQVSAVDGLERDVIDAENYATGKTLGSTVSNVAASGAGLLQNLAKTGADFYGGLLDKPLTVLSIGAAIWLFAPSLLARTRASSNPRRGRRGRR